MDIDYFTNIIVQYLFITVFMTMTVLHFIVIVLYGVFKVEVYPIFKEENLNQDTDEDRHSYSI